MTALAETLDILNALRARYASMTGGTAMGDPKDIIAALVRVLDGGSVHYAMISGMAAQVWRREPRTTLDIDLAVRSYDDLPVSELERAGFHKLARYEHTENWQAPDGSPIQFSDDPLFAEAIATAVSMPFANATVRAVSGRRHVGGRGAPRSSRLAVGRRTHRAGPRTVGSRWKCLRRPSHGSRKCFVERPKQIA